jgi:Zn-dependent protease with chaperone function
MISLLRSWLKAPVRAANSAECIAAFLRQPEHAWILRDEPFRNGLIELLCGFPLADLRHLLEKERLLILYCNRRMSCALYPYEGRSVILVFPELRRLMSSARYLEAHAVLAHELGHVFHRHAKVKISPLQAQLEADRYAWERGFGEELISVLGAEEATAESGKRIAALAGLEARSLTA